MEATQLQSLYELLLERFTKANIDNPILEIHILFNEILSIKPHQIITNPTQIINANRINTIMEWVVLKEQKVPTAYITKKQEFFYSEFYVDHRVLIPRPETEELVEWIINIHKEDSLNTVIDLCTGSGCIITSLIQNLPIRSAFAVDISPDALAVAKMNIAKHTNKVNTQVHLIESDLLTKIPTTVKADIIVSNPPYILIEEKQNIMKEVADYEPHVALFIPYSDFFEKLVQHCSQYIQIGGWLYIENQPNLLPLLQNLMSKYGFSNIEIKKDLSNKNRFIRGQYTTSYTKRG